MAIMVDTPETPTQAKDPMRQRLAQFLTVHFNPFASQQDEPLGSIQKRLRFLRGQLLIPQRQRHMEFKQRVLSQCGILCAVQGYGYARPRPFAPPIRKPGKKPTFLIDRNFLKERVSLSRCPDERMKDVAGFYEIRNQLTALGCGM